MSKGSFTRVGNDLMRIGRSLAPLAAALSLPLAVSMFGTAASAQQRVGTVTRDARGVPSIVGLAPGENWATTRIWSGTVLNPGESATVFVFKTPEQLPYQLNPGAGWTMAGMAVTAGATLLGTPLAGALVGAVIAGIGSQADKTPPPIVPTTRIVYGSQWGGSGLGGFGGWVPTQPEGTVKFDGIDMGGIEGGGGGSGSCSPNPCPKAE